MLDIDHGTYPFVTSSNCVAGAASAGGVGPGSALRAGHHQGLLQRGASAVVPSRASSISKRPASPGTRCRRRPIVPALLTGRKRRCGWFDVPALKRSIQINGVTGLCITKLDVLDGLSELKICTGYRLGGKVIDLLPMGSDDVAGCEPRTRDPARLERIDGRRDVARERCRRRRVPISRASRRYARFRSISYRPDPSAAKRSCVVIPSADRPAATALAIGKPA